MIGCGTPAQITHLITFSITETIKQLTRRLSITEDGKWKAILFLLSKSDVPSCPFIQPSALAFLS